MCVHDGVGETSKVWLYRNINASLSTTVRRDILVLLSKITRTCEMKNIVFVGACYLDTILTVPHFPVEDEKLRATSISRRRGGNGPVSHDEAVSREHRHPQDATPSDAVLTGRISASCWSHSTV